MSVASLLAAWRQDPTVAPHVAAWRREPASAGVMAPLPPDMHPELRRALGDRGIGSLYSHQEEAWRLATAGRHLVVVTGTASGKTLCYNLPVLDALLRDCGVAGALHLSHQGPRPGPARRAGRRSSAPAARQVAVAAYDGDTPAACASGDPDERPHRGDQPRHAARRHLAAPHALGRVPAQPALRGHRRDARLPRRLRLPRGQRASPPAARLPLLRGLPGLYPHLRHHRQPGGPCPALVEDEVALVDHDGSAHGPRDFVLFNPPVVDQALGVRRSALLEAVRLAQDCRDHGVQTIVFARARRSVEVVLRYLQAGRDGATAEADPARPAATAAATCPASDGRSSAACVPARCARWWRPMPWSWASTSAAWALPCWQATRAASRRRGSRRAGPGGAGRRRWPSSSPPPTPWTSSWPTTRNFSSAPRPSGP